jgi:hypothetical protein
MQVWHMQLMQLWHIAGAVDADSAAMVYVADTVVAYADSATGT